MKQKRRPIQKEDSTSFVAVEGAVQGRASEPEPPRANDATNAEKRPMIPAGRFVLVCIGIVAAAFALYLGTLHHEPVLDDHDYVLVNPLLADFENFLYPLHFSQTANAALERGMDPDFSLNFITRPVAYLTFFANRVFGGQEVAGYRLVNISIHAINGVLIFALAALLLRRQERALALWPAGLAALLFTVHPLATQSVTYITQRFESLATMFVLASVLCHLGALTRPADRVVRWLRRGSAVMCLAAMLSKETGFVTPILAVMLDWLVLGTRFPAALRRGWLLLPALVLIPGLVLAAHKAQVADAFSLWTALNVTNIGATIFDPWHYFLTQAEVSLRYLALWLFPAGQNFTHDVDLITSVLDKRWATSALVIAGIFLLGAGASKKWGRPHGMMVVAGLLWYFISLAPSSSIVPLPDLMSEQRAYLSGTGLFLALAAAADKVSLARIAIPVWMPRATGTVAALLLAAATVARNEVLRTEESIYRDSTEKSPGRARAWNGLGTALARKQKHDEALPCFEKACELKPSFVQPWENRCIVHLRHEDHAALLRVTEAAWQQGAWSQTLIYMRGVALASTGRIEESIRAFEHVIQISPAFKLAHLCLAKIHNHLGNKAAAMRFYTSAVQIGPLNPTERALIAEMLDVPGGPVATAGSDSGVSE